MVSSAMHQRLYIIVFSESCIIGFQSDPTTGHYFWGGLRVMMLYLKVKIKTSEHKDK